MCTASRVAESPVTIEDAIIRLIEVTASGHMTMRDKFEELAVPVAAAGTEISLRAGGCFCSLQRVGECVTGVCPADFCLATADVIAAVVGLHIGRPVSAEQVTSTVSNPEAGCSFRLYPGGPGVAVDVHAVFRAELEAGTRRVSPA
jgi:hypothetical protein